MSTRFKFTQRSIDQLPDHSVESRSRFAEYTDSDTVGLKVLVSKAGRKWFYARLTFNGVKKAIKLGEYPLLSLNDARLKTRELRIKGVEVSQQTMPTFADFVMVK